MANVYQIFGLSIKFHGTTDDPLPVLSGHKQDFCHVLETSFLMQRSHGTLTLDSSV